MRALSRLVILFSFLIVTRTGAVLAQVPLSAYANFEGSQVNPIRVSPDNSRLFAVNTADARVSVFDLSNPGKPSLLVEIPVGIEPVSVNPRTSDEAWIVNQESDSISIVSVSKGIVTDTIYCPDEPADVVFAGSNLAFVSVARSRLINVYDVTTHALVKSIPVVGGLPKALAVSTDGSKVYAAFAASGNGTTIIPANLAPPPPPPTNPTLPPGPQVALIVKATDPTWASAIQYTMPDNDVVVIDASSLQIVRYYTGVGTVNLALATVPASGTILVANTDALNVTPFVPNLTGHWVNNRITKISPNGQISPFDLNPGINYSVLPNPSALSIALAQPTAIAPGPNATTFYVAAFGTDRVALVDLSGSIHTRIEIGPATGSTVNPPAKRGPRGLATVPANKVLYVLNRISNSISIINTASNKVQAEIPVGTFDPTPQDIRLGRGFLYDAKLSGNGTGACASCHVDAEMDMLAWDLGDPTGIMETVVSNGQSFQEHPMKGPMVTPPMRGLANLEPYHWRGDRPDFSSFNQVFYGLMGGNQLTENQMTAYTNFINTILYQPNPYQKLDRTFPSSVQGGDPARGQYLFQNVAFSTATSQTCSTCHTVNPGTGTNGLVVQLPDDPQPLKVPHMRKIYMKLLFNTAPGSVAIEGFGLDHNGVFPNLVTFLTRPSVFPTFASSPQAKLDLSAFMLCFDTGTAPAVGYTVTVTPANLASTATRNAWQLLQAQAVAGNVDLIARGTIGGVVHGLLYQPASDNYEPDTTKLASFTFQQLNALIQGGDTLSFMGVPVGSGRRMGIDRNLDGVLDGDAPPLMASTSR